MVLIATYIGRQSERRAVIYKDICTYSQRIDSTSVDRWIIYGQPYRIEYVFPARI